MPNRVVGLFVFMLWILAIMMFWGWLLRTNVAKNPESPFWQGVAQNIG